MDAWFSRPIWIFDGLASSDITFLRPSKIHIGLQAIHYLYSTTSHAHFASTSANPIHYDFHSDAMVKQGGQSDHTIRRATSNMTQNRTVHHQSHPTLLSKSKQATPTAFDPCPPAGVSTMHFRDTRDLCCPPQPL
jgi:hypothetical protein